MTQACLPAFHAELSQGLQRDPSLAAACQGDQGLLESLATQAAQHAAEGAAGAGPAAASSGPQLSLGQFSQLLHSVAQQQGTPLVDLVKLLLVQVGGWAACCMLCATCFVLCAACCVCSCCSAGRGSGPLSLTQHTRLVSSS